MAARNPLFELYFSLAQRPSLRFMAQETGLQVSRIFRIMKRDNLKVAEWKKFSALICAKLGLEKDILALAEECLNKLDAFDLQRIQNFMECTLFYAMIKAAPAKNHERDKKNKAVEANAVSPSCLLTPPPSSSSSSSSYKSCTKQKEKAL